MKRIMAILLVLLLIPGLVACSNNEAPVIKNHNKITATKTHESTEDEIKEPIESPPEDPVALKIGCRVIIDTVPTFYYHMISDAELTYFYVDVINQWYNAYGAYAQYFGLNPNKGLDRQEYDSETGETWADYFMNLALENAKNTYALYDTAEAEDFRLSEEQLSDLDKLYAEMEENAASMEMSVDQFLQDVYGELANEASYKKYYETTVIASAYYNHYCNTLRNSYTYDQLRDFEGSESYKYNSYTYATYYLSLERFMKGNSAEDIQSAKNTLQAAAEELSGSDLTTVALLNQAIEDMEYRWLGSTSPSTATEYTQVLHSQVAVLMQEWIGDSSRKSGDITALADYSYSTDGTETQTLNGYYIVLFRECHDNYIPLANVRHILIQPEGGTYDSITGTPVYTDAEKMAAKDKAEQVLAEWQSGAATEDSFAQLANRYSADGDGTTGGLYEDVYPGQMVTNFNDWCFDPERRPGDTGIVESEYGYHVMFYSGVSDENFRDYMVSNDLLTKDVTAWQEALLDDTTVEELDTDRIDTNLTLKA